MARSKPDTRQATETLQEIEGAFDRLAHWVQTHPAHVLAVLGAVLVVAAALGFADWSRNRSLDRAAAEVAEVQSEYLRAMGAGAGSYEIVEPANPETGRRVRREYVDRFLAAADAHEGTAAAVSALLEAGTLQAEMGDLDAAVSTWERARDQAAGEAHCAGWPESGWPAGWSSRAAGRRPRRPTRPREPSRRFPRGRWPWRTRRAATRRPATGRRPSTSTSDSRPWRTPLRSRTT